MYGVAAKDQGTRVRDAQPSLSRRSRKKRKSERAFANRTKTGTIQRPTNMPARGGAPPEATCYRRFASLLEVLLDGTDITVIEGGKASRATKQQSKNLRTNASMLRHMLYPLNHELDTTMAIDFIGTNGYLYALRVVNDDFYIAKSISQLLYPKKPESLDHFLDTLKSIFYLKHFLRTTAKLAKKALYQRKANNALPTLNISAPSPVSTPTPPYRVQIRRYFHNENKDKPSKSTTWNGPRRICLFGLKETRHQIMAHHTWTFILERYVFSLSQKKKRRGDIKVVHWMMPIFDY